MDAKEQLEVVVMGNVWTYEWLVVAKRVVGVAL